ncbi:hypothetical protein [Bradyrhizobium sp. CCBAU 11386]|uniref:hypothetical protein n=1 Tax=Bradyrhizobium sp. CCBAU 11386 TaxID=1630837 RepID=UPI0023033B0B|nr:hypothetical protein [Bradyrhizobium sp. CCBAU 11386]
MTEFPMLGDMIQHALARRAEFELLPQIASLAEIPAHWPLQQPPDLIVTGLRRGEDESIAQAIHTLVPGALVVTIASDLQSASAHRLGCAPDELSPLSETSLAAEILRLVHRA